MIINWSWSLVMLGALVTASTSLQDRQVAPNVYSGLYSIRNCGQNATQVVDRLRDLWTILQPSLSEASSTHTTAAYQIFFKDVIYAPFVKGVLRNISAGTPMLPAQVAHGFSTSSPIITCVSTMPDPHEASVPFSPYISAIAAGYHHCRSDPTRAMGAYIQGTPLIVLCPLFWGALAKPTRRKCNRVNEATNQFRDDGSSLANTQVSVLLHELVHFYSEATTGVQLAHEMIRINDCVGLDAKQSRLNPNNYVYYVSSILYGCRNFPRPRLSTDGRELLSSNSNKTSDAINANDTSNET